jgi:menaquinone-dependent protoporphyrinogen oxidase
MDAAEKLFARRGTFDRTVREFIGAVAESLPGAELTDIFWGYNFLTGTNTYGQREPARSTLPHGSTSEALAMNLLLLYGTTEGQTEKVACFVAEHLAQQGHQTALVNAIDATAAVDPSKVDAVIVAASLHAGRYQSGVIHFVREHLGTINARPNAFLSVSLAAASDDAADVQGLKKCIADFIHQTGWTPQYIHHVAGAFRYTSYDFLKRWAMKYIAYRKGASTDTSRDHELTDWADLARFADAFIKSMR